MKNIDETKILNNISNMSCVDDDKSKGFSLESMENALNTPQLAFDPELIKIECDRQAKEMINKTLKTLLPAGNSINQPYIQSKIKIDVDMLSSIMYQHKISEKIQSTLVKEINSGACNPRYYDTFTTMTKQIGELNKQVLQTVEVIKTTITSMIVVLQERELINSGPQNTTNSLPVGNNDKCVIDENGAKMTGSKDWIKKIQHLHDNSALKSVDVPDQIERIEIKP